MATAETSSSSERIDLNEETVFDKVLVYDPEDLPDTVKDELNTLTEELEQGDITHQGYSKKKYVLLERYSQQHVEQSSMVCQDNEKTVELIEPEVTDLPPYVVLQLQELEREYEDEELTFKGYSKRRGKILEPYMLKEPSFENLPHSTQMKLKELETELEEGDVTEKGFQKKRKSLIKPFLVPINPAIFRRKRKLSSDRKNNNTPNKGFTLKNAPKAIYSESVDMDGVKLFKCSICEEVFRQPQSFSAHCRTHRDASTCIKCDHCDATFTTKSHLKIHMFKHTGQYPFVCAICGKGFGQRGNLRVHEERHTKKTCEYCGATFLIRSRFVSHQQDCRRKYSKIVVADVAHPNTNLMDNKDESQEVMSSLNSDTEIAIEITNTVEDGDNDRDIGDIKDVEDIRDVIGKAQPNAEKNIVENIKTDNVDDNTFCSNIELNISSERVTESHENNIMEHLSESHGNDIAEGVVIVVPVNDGNG